MKKRSSILAVISSIVEPGLGLVYVGLSTSGALVAVGGLILQFTILFSGILRSFCATATLYLIVLAVPRIVFAIYCPIRAVSVPSILPTRFNRWFVYVILAAMPHVPGRVIPLINQWMPCTVVTLRTVSMQPTIEPDELVVVDRRYYNSHSLEPGDVIQFRSPLDSSSSFVKRCVALGNQKVQIRDGVLFVDDKQYAPRLPLKRSSDKILTHDFKDDRIRPAGAGNEDQYGPVIVPENCCFVLGDHRDNSLDSRYFGFLEKRYLFGKVLYIFLSPNIDRMGKTVF